MHRGPFQLRSVVDFFNHVNMLYGTISEFCTPTEVGFPSFQEADISVQL